MKDFADEKGAMYKWNKVEAIPNAKITLQLLTEHSKCYIVTNAENSTKGEIIEALKRVDLHEYFSNIFCFKEIGFKKPTKEYFENVLKRLPYNLNEIIMIGDNLQKDILSAKKFGIKSILFDWKNKYPNYKGYKIVDLMELTNITDQQLICNNNVRYNPDKTRTMSR